ncbi:hypothetical protein Enr17x_46610 [Gimesia fumaroli]|uniref:Uncharacterized protein n=1 Tax=Gimesia fumaroli TaxID=2527976 RepID=A0A518IHP0_9PLAN|nr:hypothetical protein Enr17x_46610 [Gimesia fumaroli]
MYLLEIWQAVLFGLLLGELCLWGSLSPFEETHVMD